MNKRIYDELIYTLQEHCEMERTGGEPDVIGRDEATGAFVFCDCSPESLAGRRSLCYDQVFVHPNGADSYYAARGFRGLVRV